MSFAHQLLGAWRMAGLDASPRVAPEEGVTCCCPRCERPTRLDVAEGIVLCPACGWGAEGHAWEIAKAARGGLPPRAQSMSGSAVSASTDTLPSGAETSAASGGAAAEHGTRDAAPTLPLWDLDGLLAYTPDPREEIWPDGVLSMGERTALVGAPGVGKSRLALQAAIYTLLGRDFLGWQTRGTGLKWLFLQTENSARRLKADLTAMTRHLTAADKAAVRDGMRILNVGALDFASICMVDGHPDRVRILATLDAWQPDIVVIDPLRDAGCGDPNKDADMTETCAGISSVIRHGNPRRVPLIIHHGRTGSQEAARVFGDDAASFARNSKVLYGWLRSQINVAPAGVEHPEVIICGCGKNSNGPRWEPFAAVLDAHTMSYRRLEPQEFDLDEWADERGEKSRAKKPAGKTASPENIAALVEKSGGVVRGGVRSADGLVERVRREFSITRIAAEDAVNSAVDQRLIDAIDEPRQTGRGGSPLRIYTLNPSKIYAPK